MSHPLEPPIGRMLQLVETDGRTRGEIAAAAGMSSAQLSQILNGHRTNPSITTVARILAAIRKSWKDLDTQEEKRGKRRSKH